MESRPSTKFTDATKIPVYLAKHGLFCLWKYENIKGRWTKKPYQPKATQYGAASTNAAHFTNLQTAMAARSGFDGVGLGIFGDLAAIDIDHCVGADGELSQLAQTVIETMDSYTEYSPSGKGIRIIFRASGVEYDTEYYINNQNARDPGQKWPEKQGLEVYIAGVTSKFVTVTGNAIKPVEVAERSTQIRQTPDRHPTKPTAERTAPAPTPSMMSLSDLDLLGIAARARNGAQFSRLYYDGDTSGYASHSEADQALMNLLAFYCAGDAARMIQLFKASALHRPDKSGGEKYLERTAQKAIKGCTTYYTPPQAKREAASKKPTAPAEDPQQATQTTGNAVDAFLKKARSRAFEPIPTGYKTIDAAIGGGFIRQTIVLLGAAPGAGKTIFAQQVFEKIAKDGKANVLYYNLEMSVEQLIARSLSRDTEWPALTILQGYKWTKEQTPVILEAAEHYKREIAPRMKYITGSADYRLILESMEHEAKALEGNSEALPLCVCVDYLQLLQGEGKDDVEIIKSAVKSFKDFAIAHNAVVFLIMAHSRATNESGEVKQGAGRDTSAIEYSADLQLALTYSAMHEKDGKGKQKYPSLSSLFAEVGSLRDDGNQRAAEDLIKWRKLTVTKNRFGEESTSCSLSFEGQFSRFWEKAPKAYDRMWERQRGSNIPTV